MNEFGDGKKIINPMSIISFFLFLNFLYVAVLGLGRSPIIFFAIFSASTPETLMTLIPPIPPAVAQATIVSSMYGFLGSML